MSIWLPIVILFGLILVVLIWALIKEDYGGSWQRDDDYEEDE